jgi:RimJ/RimL family protein N-acetyltransferase/DNA-binding CsgD family transcriptional regulator
VPPETPPILSDGRLTLRPPVSSDAFDILEGCQDPEITRWTSVPSPYEIADARAFLNDRLTPSQWWRNPTWVITEGENRWIGTVALHPDGLGAAEIGYMVAPGHRGRGVGTAAIRLVCTWALQQWDQQVITWRAMVGNVASRALAEAVGFRIHADVARLALADRGGRVDAWVGELLPADLIAASAPMPTSSSTRPSLAARVKSPAIALTRREQQVLDLLAAGEPNRAIATSLGISENTVKNHVRALLEKLHARSRTDAVVRGVGLGLTRIPG